MAVAEAARRLAGGEVIGALIGQHRRLHVEQGDIDMLAFTRTVAMGQGGQDARRRIHAGKQVDHRDADLHRLAIRLAGDAHQPAHALDHGVIAGTVGIGACLAEAGDRAIDQVGLDRLEARVIEAVFDQRAALEILDHHIGLGGEFAHLGGTLRPGEVERHRALVAVGAGEIGRDSLGLSFEPGRTPGAGVVALAGTLHLDHPGAEVAEKLRCPRSRQDAGQIKHLQVRERPAGHLLIYRGTACISCPNRTGKDRYGRLSAYRARPAS